MSLKVSIKSKLLDIATNTEGIRGRFRMAAGVVYKGKLIATGVAQYKTHPIMMNSGYRKEQVFLHAEADALIRASRSLSESQLKDAEVYVVRLKKDGSEGLAKPCEGCMGLLSGFGISKVEYTKG